MLRPFDRWVNFFLVYERDEILGRHINSNFSISCTAKSKVCRDVWDSYAFEICMWTRIFTEVKKKQWRKKRVSSCGQRRRGLCCELTAETSQHDISISIKCLIGVYISSFGEPNKRQEIVISACVLFSFNLLLHLFLCLFVFVVVAQLSSKHALYSLISRFYTLFWLLGRIHLRICSRILPPSPSLSFPRLSYIFAKETRRAYTKRTARPYVSLSRTSRRSEQTGKGAKIQLTYAYGQFCIRNGRGYVPTFITTVYYYRYILTKLHGFMDNHYWKCSSHWTLGFQILLIGREMVSWHRKTCAFINVFTIPINVTERSSSRPKRKEGVIFAYICV